MPVSLPPRCFKMECKVYNMGMGRIWVSGSRERFKIDQKCSHRDVQFKAWTCIGDISLLSLHRHRYRYDATPQNRAGKYYFHSQGGKCYNTCLLQTGLTAYHRFTLTSTGISGCISTIYFNASITLRQFPPAAHTCGKHGS